MTKVDRVPNPLFDWCRERWLAVVCVVIVGGLVIFGIPLAVEYMGWDITTPESKFWLQTAAGNWPPDSFPSFVRAAQQGAIDAGSVRFELSPWERHLLSLSAVVAVFLNNGLILVIIGLVWRLIIEVRKVMKMDLVQAFATRDQMIKQALFSVIEDGDEFTNKVNIAFENAKKNWKPHAQAIFGKRAEEFFKEQKLSK